MSRNYGIGSRNMEFAFITLIASLYVSYSSIATAKTRLRCFVKWLKSNTKVKKMEQITQQDVKDFAHDLLAKNYAIKTIHSYVSATNVCMVAAREDREIWVSVDRDTDVPRKSNRAKYFKGIEEKKHCDLISKCSAEVASILELNRRLGLRFKEASLLDSRAALEEFINTNKVSIEYGTKGGRKRVVEPHKSQFSLVREALKVATELQEDRRNMILVDESYKQFQGRCYQELTELGAKFHSERHSFANLQYELLMSECLGVKVLTPVTDDFYKDKKGGWCKYLAEKHCLAIEEVKQIDYDVRMNIAESLGHSRIDIISSYIGEI